MSNTLFLINTLGKCAFRKAGLKSVFKNPIRKFHSSKIPSNLNLKSQATSIKYLLTGGSILGGLGFGYQALSKKNEIEYLKEKLKELLEYLAGNLIVYCEAKPSSKQNRTAHYEETIRTEGKKGKKEKSDSFDWIEFLKLIYKEKFYFLAAIVVCFRVFII